MSQTVASNLTSRLTRQRRAPGRRGFSLIEMLVVTGIIVLLAGIVIGVGVKMRAGVKDAQTRATMASLKACADEYETQTKLRIPHVDGLAGLTGYTQVDWSKPKAMNADGASGTALVDDSIERFVWVAYQLPACKKMLTALGDTILRDADEDGFLEVLDGWERKIRYSVAVLHDDDRDQNVNDQEGDLDLDDDLPIHDAPCFASSGEDGLWGHAKTPSLNDSNGDGVDDGADNIYSYEQPTR